MSIFAVKIQNTIFHWFQFCFLSESEMQLGTTFYALYFHCQSDAIANTREISSSMLYIFYNL